MTQPDENLINLIITKYQNLESIKKISEDVNLEYNKVYEILKSNNIQMRGPKSQLDPNQIISLYKSGLSSTKIGQMYNVCTHTITNLLNKYNIPRNNLYHNINLIEDYWEVIDTKDKAYFLGFLIADGNVIGNAVRLSLNIKDEEILEVFSRVTHNENKLNYDLRNCVTFGVKRRQWVNDLAKYGVIPNKTRTVTVPVISDELMPHLLRGLIDGDGWVTSSHKIGFCGNLQSVTQVQNYLVNKLNVYNVKIIQCRKSELYMIQWASKKDFLSICEYIYKDKEDFYLKRKYNNYLIVNGNTEVITEIA